MNRIIYLNDAASGDYVTDDCVTNLPPPPGCQVDQKGDGCAGATTCDTMQNAPPPPLTPPGSPFEPQ